MFLLELRGMVYYALASAQSKVIVVEGTQFTIEKYSIFFYTLILIP